MVKKTDFNAKITEVEGKIPSISGLATSSALTAVENKIPDISGLAASSALTAVENEIPYVTSLVTKTDFDSKLKAISDKVTKNKSKHLLEENELKKLKTLALSYFWGKNYFEGDDGTQNVLVFQPAYKYFKTIKERVLRLGLPNEFIIEWKSKGLNDVIKSPDNTLAPGIESIGKKMHAKFKGGYLKQDKPAFNHGKIVNIYIVYDLESNLNNFDLAIENCLF